MIALALVTGFFAGILFVAVVTIAWLWYETRNDPLPNPRSFRSERHVTVRTCGRCGSQFCDDAWHTCPRERARPS